MLQLRIAAISLFLVSVLLNACQPAAETANNEEFSRPDFELATAQPKVMGKVLGIVYRTIATQLTHKADYTKSTAHTWAVTLVQRFGGVS